MFASAGQQHWHGAAPTSFLLHTSVAMGTTTWLEEVSDADYQLGLDQGDPPNGLNPPRTRVARSEGAGHAGGGSGGSC